MWFLTFLAADCLTRDIRLMLENYYVALDQVATSESMVALQEPDRLYLGPLGWVLALAARSAIYWQRLLMCMPD